MRIIRGRYKTRYFQYPKNFPSRPTTDFAKEGLFNVLENEFFLYDLEVLDLCAGTGSITFEFLSRESGNVTAVDNNFICIKHLMKLSKELEVGNELIIVKDDLLRFLEKNNKKFDIIFADPPYAYPDHDKIHSLVFDNDLLNEGGLLIIEHGKDTDLTNQTYFQKMRKYGGVCFSFFKKD